MGPAGMGSADKASKVKSLLASYYDTDDLGSDSSPSLHDTPRYEARVRWGRQVYVSADRLQVGHACTPCCLVNIQC